MAENSKISWCDQSTNLWWGCAKVHTGCLNCYAEILSDSRYEKGLWGEKGKRQRILSAFKDLNRYQKNAKQLNITYKVFMGSMMDMFEADKPLMNPDEEFKTTSQLRAKLFDLICSGHYDRIIFLFLTKRPENIALLVPESWRNNAPKNVWFGTSISNQETADEYVPILQQYQGNNLFLSIEPQVCQINTLDLTGISWVIVGGESGSASRRPFSIEWAHQLKAICQQQNVAYFFKQVDKIIPIPDDLHIQEFPKQMIVHG